MRAELEPQHFDKPTGYYLGVKTRVDRTKLALYLSDGNKFKFMPRSMEQVAIFGVELKEQNYPPLELPAQSDLHYFSLVPGPTPGAGIRSNRTRPFPWFGTTPNSICPTPPSPST